MRNNSVIIATSADFLADILRDTLQNLNMGVIVAHNENELLARIDAA
jgi:hypothetical protein